MGISNYALDILGHSDAKVTQRYAHLSSRSLQDAANTASVMLRRSLTQPSVRYSASKLMFSRAQPGNSHQPPKLSDRSAACADVLQHLLLRI